MSGVASRLKVQSREDFAKVSYDANPDKVDEEIQSFTMLGNSFWAVMHDSLCFFTISVSLGSLRLWNCNCPSFIASTDDMGLIRVLEGSRPAK
jgi:hypothetical protein